MTGQWIGPGVAVLAAACCLAACGIGGGPVYVRVGNASQVSFDSIEVRFPNQTEHYGALSIGEFSEYREVRGAYQYAYAEVHSGEQRFVLQPIDYLGAELLAPGRYTYHLSVHVSDAPDEASGLDGYMGFKLEKDPDDDGSAPHEGQ